VQSQNLKNSWRILHLYSRGRELLCAMYFTQSISFLWYEKSWARCWVH